MIAALLFSNPWPWWIAVPLAVGIGALLVWLYRRERSYVSRPVGWLLTTLRIAAAIMLFLTILGPVLSTQVTRTSKDWLLLLVDQSRSMSIRDNSKGPSRFEQAQKTFDDALLRKLQGVCQIRPYRFAAGVSGSDPKSLWSAPDGDASDLGRPSVAALMDMANERVGAVVVVSDGGHNWGPNPMEAAAKLAERQVKLYTVGVGPTTPPKDVTVTEVATSGLVFAGDQATAMAVVRTSGFRGQRLPVRIMQEGNVVGEATLTPESDQGRDTVAVSFTPSGEGSRLLRAEVVPQPGEANAENNARDFRVQVLKDRLRVLLIESQPRWEFRYLKNDLLRDKAVDLSTLLLAEPKHPPLPSSRQEWFKNLIVILGDLTPDQLSTTALQQLESFVADNGGALIVLAGPRGMPAAWRGQRLLDLLPVVPGPNAIEGKELPVQLSAAGRENPITHLEPDAAANERLWASLPPFLWQAQVAETKPAAVTLLATPASPLLVTQYYGIGKVLFLGSDNTWRWRFKVADEYFHRFWGQIIRWAARSAFSARDQHVMIGTARDEVAEGEPVNVEARVLSTDLSPLNDAEVTAVVTVAERASVQPEERKPNAGAFGYGAGALSYRRARMDYVAGSGGLYRCAINDLPRGEYKLQLEVPALPDKLSKAAASFGVRTRQSQEMQDVAMNEPLLREMAAMTGGKFYRLDQARQLADDLKFLQRREQVTLELEVWDTPWWFLAFCALIITEWGVRKWKGLV